MAAGLVAGTLLAALASTQDPPPQSAADLDKRAKESLQKKVSLAGIEGLTLPELFFMFATANDEDIEIYVDPVAVPKLDDLKISFAGEAPLDEVLKKSLKEKDLLHHVWQGIVVITNEKGRKALQETDWAGLSQKVLREHAELSKKLDTPYTFQWSPFEPQEALKQFAEASGVAINADALAGFDLKKEKRGLLSARRTTLRGALVCLARTTGITYEVSKNGALVAKLPPKK